MHRHPSKPPDEPDDELARVREVLERTKRFLAHCAEDPTAALAAEDPRDLIRGLESLSVAPEPDVAADEPRTIQIRRRKSA